MKSYKEKGRLYALVEEEFQELPSLSTKDTLSLGANIYLTRRDEHLHNLRCKECYKYGNTKTYATTELSASAC